MATKKTVQFDENYGRIKVNFAATLDRTEHKLMLKNEDL